MNHTARQWLEHNRPFSANHAYGQDAPNAVRFTARSGEYLFTAPHAVHHYRDETLPDKQSDARTGGLAELLGQRLNCSVLAASGFVQEWHSWQERQDDFPRRLKQAVHGGRFVIDFHGMSDSHDVDVCLGLGAYPSEKTQRIAKALVKALHPLNVQIDTPFTATPAFTVVSFVQSLGGDGLQVEIAAYLRDPKRQPDQAANFADMFARALREVSAGV
jgi:hypothetical protein